MEDILEDPDEERVTLLYEDLHEDQDEERVTLLCDDGSPTVDRGEYSITKIFKILFITLLSATAGLAWKDTARQGMLQLTDDPIALDLAEGGLILTYFFASLWLYQTTIKEISRPYYSEPDQDKLREQRTLERKVLPFILILGTFSAISGTYAAYKFSDRPGFAITACPNIFAFRFVGQMILFRFIVDSYRAYSPWRSNNSRKIAKWRNTFINDIQETLELANAQRDHEYVTKLEAYENGPTQSPYQAEIFQFLLTYVSVHEKQFASRWHKGHPQLMLLALILGAPFVSFIVNVVFSIDAADKLFSSSPVMKILLISLGDVPALAVDLLAANTLTSALYRTIFYKVQYSHSSSASVSHFPYLYTACFCLSIFLSATTAASRGHITSVTLPFSKTTNTALTIPYVITATITEVFMTLSIIFNLALAALLRFSSRIQPNNMNGISAERGVSKISNFFKRADDTFICDLQVPETASRP